MEMMIIGSKLIFLENPASTNTSAGGLLREEKLPEGSVIYTNYQTAGKGQPGNFWESEDGKNLLLSIVLYPDMIAAEDQFIISMSVSIGICDFLKNHIPGCKIKWPNDIYAGNDKIAGILIENSMIGTKIENTVVGIGININQEVFRSSAPNPVSLKMLTGKEYNREICMKELLNCLDKRYKHLLAGKYREIKEEYTSSLYRLMEWHQFKTRQGIINGRIVSVSDTGALRIEDEKTAISEFLFKEIAFIL